jgi:predicted AAA+ superfamily ATPase
VIEEHLAQNRQMVLISGPRQAGKTTISLEASLESPFHYYFNWDNDDHRALIIAGPKEVAAAAN